MSHTGASEIYMDVYAPELPEDCESPDDLGKVQAFGYTLTPDETEAFARWLLDVAATARRAAAPDRRPS